MATTAAFFYLIFYMIKINKEPALSVHFSVCDSHIQKVVLIPDIQFTCLIEGEQILTEEIVDWLQQYAQKKGPLLTLPLLPVAGRFNQKALEVLSKIPFGETLTYKQVAEKLDSPNAARAVGNSCHVNPYPLIIPCHRVVKTGGEIGGFAYGFTTKKILLDFEMGKTGAR